MGGGPSAGIPRAALRSGINLEVLTFWLFTPYTAHVLNFIIIHAIGFWGMYAFLNRYGLTGSGMTFTRTAIAFLFALVPCYTVHGISVSGQPLLLFAFLNLLHQRGRWTDWLIIGLFPFYSFLIWAGLFICAALVLIGLVDVVRNRTPLNRSFWGGLCLLVALYLLCEWQMIYSFLAKTFVSHRTEYDYSRLMPITVADSLQKSVHLFIQTQYHSGAFFTLWIMLTVWLSLLWAYRNKQFAAIRALVSWVAVIALICLFSGFYRFPAVWFGPGNLLQSFQFDRFYFLLPFLWFYLFALALKGLSAQAWLRNLLLAGQLGIMLLANTEWRINAGQLAGHSPDQEHPSYRRFYDPALLARLRNYIGKPQSSYRVVSIGIHPAVAIYNGFYTLDSYQNNYLLTYKHAFRNVIAPELDKAPAIKTYFDAYGCRCYTFTAELGISPESFLCHKQVHRTIQNLSLNTKALRAMGGTYIISAVPIQHAAQHNLKLETIFDTPESYWRLWLYAVE